MPKEPFVVRSEETGEFAIVTRDYASSFNPEPGKCFPKRLANDYIPTQHYGPWRVVFNFTEEQAKIINMLDNIDQTLNPTDMDNTPLVVMESLMKLAAEAGPFKGKEKKTR